MALRAFRSNPSLGGFGGESRVPVATGAHAANAGAVEKDCDAFGQIIKELVDNAVDACSIDNENNQNEPKRVRVIIRQLQDDDQALSDGADREDCDQILRVTVIDNGCGMENVEECVDAFHSSKADSSSQTNDEEAKDQENSTAGRYGIGLTLCLLHAQRLVPNSYASITSATSTASEFTRASYVVDVDGDSIRCDKIEMIPKKSPDERGTAVSVLVPGGQTTLHAWPRLAEYFARFQLSLGLTCSLEVLAPSLSSVPLFIRPSVERAPKNLAPQETSTEADTPLEENIEPAKEIPEELPEDRDFWTDGMAEEDKVCDNEASQLPQSSLPQDKAKDNPNETRSEDEHTNAESKKQAKKAGTDREGLASERRQELLVAATTYLKRPVLLKNVAHSIQPIRWSGESNGVERPMLEVDMIVYDPHDDGASDSDEEEHRNCNSSTANRNANLMLVRMVNRVPLLDGAEASACGLVRGLCWKQSTWNSFGLHVTPSDERTELCRQRTIVDEHDCGYVPAPSVLRHLFAPTYEVRDSDQVAPFFENSTHSQLETDEIDDEDSRDSDHEEDVDDWDDICVGQKRRKSRKRRKLLPAHVRLGNILVIAQIHAKPSSLPLPTLSKGRLPMNESSIDDALELGILSCLRSLQTSNPTLLLTAQQLKLTERDARYIPSTAAAIASIACKSKNETFRISIAQSVQKWASMGGTDIEESLSRLMAESESNSRRDESALTASRHSEDEAEATSAVPSSATVALFRLTTLGPVIEERLRKICSDDRKKPSRRQKSDKKKRNEESDDDHSDRGVGLDDLLDVEECFSEVSDNDEKSDSEGEPGGRILDKWEDPFNDDDDSW